MTARGHTSTTLNEAATYFLRTDGETEDYPHGHFAEPIRRAEEQGTLAVEVVE